MSAVSDQAGMPVGKPISGKLRSALNTRRVIILLLLAVGAAQFARQVPPVRANGFLWDFSNVSSASRVFLAGGDPFKIEEVKRSWEQEPHDRWLAPDNGAWLWVWCPIYPPPSLVMIAPVAMLHPAEAHLLWVMIDLVLFTLMIRALWELAGLTTYDDRLLLIACLLAAAPVIDVFQSGQLGLPACAGVILAAWAMRRKKPVLAGVILGLSMALKFQVAGPFVVYYLLIRQWRAANLAISLFVMISLIGIIPLEAHHVPWLNEWMSNAAQSLGPGMGNDPRPFGPFRDDMVNVQTWLYGLIGDDQIVRTLAILCFALPATAFLAGLRRSDRRPDDLLALACVASLSFVPAYRRLYDATVLAVLVAWAIAALHTPLRKFAIVTLVLLGEFLLPIEIVPMILRHTRELQRFVDTRFWQTAIVPHHAWAMLVLAAWTTALYLRLHQRVPVTQLRAGDMNSFADEVDLHGPVTF